METVPRRILNNLWRHTVLRGFPDGSIVRNLPANTGDTGDSGSIPGSRRSPGGSHGNPLQYSCLENLMDRGAWWATVHGVTKNQTRLKQLSSMQAQRCMVVFRCFKVVQL